MGSSQSKLTPEQISDIQKTTHFDKAKIKACYKDFMRDYPNGQLNRKEFDKIHRQFFPSGDPTGMSDHVFDALDTDKSGAIDFKEFISAFSIASRGSLDEKLKWIFCLHDLDNDGEITQDEFLLIVHSVYKMVGEMAEPPEDERTPKERAEKLFKATDKNADGKLTYEELLSGIKRDPELFKALSSSGEALLRRTGTPG